MKEVFDFMEMFDDSDLADGAWQATLEDAVTQFNEANGTKHDPFETFLAYLHRNE